ncbi:hypothetical protein B484DRAFT_398532 [Ochromonadaceae sp. CCMP2298]|nr:hypothetical protein B484DRAFT_398532 [Ochromonadaceae sp. CCMP2298]
MNEGLKDNLASVAGAGVDGSASNGTSDAQKYSHLYVYSGANKAGMQAVDKEKQAQIIYDMSKNSAFFKRAAKLDEEADVRTQAMKKLLAEVRGGLETRLCEQVMSQSLELESRRSFDRVCCVLDMDMFFAAVEIRDQPHLRDVPVAVGGLGMIATSNYVARRYGVRAAMPGFIAKKLCPSLVFLAPNYAKYSAASALMKEVISRYDSAASAHSLDEVYFDLTDAALAALRGKVVGRRESSAGNGGAGVAENTESNQEQQGQGEASATTSGTAVELLHHIRAQITEVTGGLTCSAGIANNFMLAKIGADQNKPDGQYELPPTRQSVMDFAAALPTRKVGGIGKLLHVCTPALAQFLLRASLGIGAGEGEEGQGLEGDESAREHKRKSLGCERTYSGGIKGAEIREKIHCICISLAEDMEREALWAKTVTLKMKLVNFELLTRSATHSAYFRTAEVIESIARALLQPLQQGLCVRLIGLSAKHHTLEKFLTHGQVGKQEREQQQREREQAFDCPVCAHRIPGGLASFNLHLDRCLDGQDSTPHGSAHSSNNAGKIGTAWNVRTAEVTGVGEKKRKASSLDNFFAGK